MDGLIVVAAIIFLILVILAFGFIARKMYIEGTGKEYFAFVFLGMFALIFFLESIIFGGNALAITTFTYEPTMLLVAALLYIGMIVCGIYIVVDSVKEKKKTRKKKR